MASVDKASVREQLDTLKAQYEALCAEGKMGAESRTLFQGLLTLIELLMAVFMEKNTPKTARNSGLPPSQTAKEQAPASRSGTKSKGAEPETARSPNTRTIETAAVAAVDSCAGCGEALGATPALEHERRTRIDIVFEKTLEHVDAEVKQCPRCQTQTKGTFPQELAGQAQYGPGIKAYVLNLLVAQMLSLKRVQQSVQTLIGRALSEASILKYVMELHHALAAWEQSAKDQLLEQPAMHVDETSLRVDRKNHWIHVYAAGNITLKVLHPKRGQEAINAINIIPPYEGYIIHDCWASYLAYNQCGHGLCGAHLLRELTHAVEANGYRWAADLKRLLQDACAQVAERDAKRLTDAEYKKLRKRYRTILTQGGKELPPIPPKPEGKRGQTAKPDAHNLWERLKRHEQAVLLFAHSPDVPFTNNRAERDLRPAKVKQKVSGCFRTRQYAEAYCRISSYLQTMTHHGYNPFVAIQMALSGKLYEEGGE
ncbi:MAG: IS66 family transposase [Thiohalorhabdaceae bacterium]